MCGVTACFSSLLIYWTGLDEGQFTDLSSQSTDNLSSEFTVDPVLVLIKVAQGRFPFTDLSRRRPNVSFDWLLLRHSHHF